MAMEMNPCTASEASNSTASNKKNEETPEHPYEAELTGFKPQPWQLEHREVEAYKSVDETVFTYVDTKELFDGMLLKLKKAKEFAMDVEHHDHHSWKGVVCLVQISTREEDFVIDTIALKDVMGQLNDFCTNSSILKVLHGSSFDIEWLQKGFRIFIVNMFDTQKAAEALQEERIGLAWLLKKYCDVQVNKRFQMTDWRIRPLSEEKLLYARQDAHFLLYLKDLFQNALLKCKPPKLMDVYKSSTQICRSLYREPVFQPDAYLNCCRKLKKGGKKLNKDQMECFRLLYEWRYYLSMEMDKSIGYTLSNKMMMKISQALPQDPDGVIRCCMPMDPTVRKVMERNKVAISTIVKASRKVGNSTQEERPGQSPRSVQFKNMKKNKNAKMKSNKKRRRQDVNI